MKSALDSDKFQLVVDFAAKQLVQVSHGLSGSLISTPLLYVSGSYVVVRIEKTVDSYFVSDFGMGYLESEMLGGASIYRRHATAIAEASAIGFDQHAFFAIRVSEAQIAGAVATIANCSQEAVAVTAMKVGERKAKDDAEELYIRLAGVFSKRAVVRDVQVVGASNTSWHISNLLTLGNSKVAFESVTPSPNSVVFAATKFQDLSRLEKSPGRVSVVVEKEALGTYLGVLTQSSNVIERRIADEGFRNVARNAA